jgi:hypothetical protein
MHQRFFPNSSAFTLMALFAGVPAAALFVSFGVMRTAPGVGMAIAMSGIAVGVHCFLSWIAEGIEVAHRVTPMERRLPTMPSTLCLWFTRLYVVAFFMASLSASFSSSPFRISEFMGVVLALNLVAMAASATLMVLFAMHLARAETPSGQSTVLATIVNLLLLWMWMPGIFWLQPKVRGFAGL